MGAGRMSRLRILALTSLAMLAFAANSLLCRAALDHTVIDAASFTAIRLLSGAVMLSLLARCKHPQPRRSGNWMAAAALFVYAAGFSFAYQHLPAATGALLLFGAVQISMIGYGLFKGERFAGWQWFGLVLAIAGLLGLLSPGASAPSFGGSLLMILAGAAWGVYSISGKTGGDPLSISAGNFLRSLPFTAVLVVLTFHHVRVDSSGAIYAVLSGALASGMGYAVWYSVLPQLKAIHAATVQLSVPVVAATGGAFLLGEAIDPRLVLTSLAILGGIALIILEKRKPVSF